MRITPLSVWAYQLSLENIKKVSYLDSKLTHAAPAALNAVATYNVGIAHLLKNVGDATGAYLAMQEFVKTLDDSTLQSWWDEVQDDKLPDATKKIGWI